MKHILYIQTAFIGDLLLAIPALKQIRQTQGPCEIHLMCRKGLGDFFIRTQLVEKTIEVSKSKPNRFKPNNSSNNPLDGLLSHYDIVLCAHESFRTALRVAKIKSPLKVGFLKPWNFWAFHAWQKRNVRQAEALRQLSLLEALTKYQRKYQGKHQDKYQDHHQDHHPNKQQDKQQDQLLNNSQSTNPTKTRLVDSWSMEYQIPNNETMSLREIFSTKKGEYLDLLRQLGLSHKINSSLSTSSSPDSPQNGFVYLVPGSVWATKMWPIEHFIELARLLDQEGYQVLVTGAKAEEIICEKICKQVPNAINIAGKTSLYEGALLFYFAKLVIANDSGAMHLAATQDTPTIAIFGPTVLRFGYRPWNNNAKVIENNQVRCRPCGKHGPNKCPIGTHECMRSLTPEAVFASATTSFRAP